MEKIQMTTPLVEMDGDEMTRVLWQQIKDELLLPYIDLKTEYYDLGLPERERTKDQVTVDSAEPPRSTAWRSSAPPSPPTPSGWRSTGSPRCGSLPTAPSAPSWTAPCSAPLSLVRGSLPVGQDLEASHHHRTPRYATVHRLRPSTGCPAPAGPSWCSPARTGRRNSARPSTTLSAPVCSRASTTRTAPSPPSPVPASSTPLTPNRTCGSPPRTPSPSSTTTPSRTSSSHLRRRV